MTRYSSMSFRLRDATAIAATTVQCTVVSQSARGLCPKGKRSGEIHKKSGTVSFRSFLFRYTFVLGRHAARNARAARYDIACRRLYRGHRVIERNRHAARSFCHLLVVILQIDFVIFKSSQNAILFYIRYLFYHLYNQLLDLICIKKS